MVISTPFPPEEGIGYYVYNLSKKMIEKGHKVTVITKGKLKIEKINFDGICVFKVPFIPLYPFHISIYGYFINKMLKKIENNFDIIHIHTPLSPVIKTSLPIVSTVHTSVIEDARHIEIVDIKSLLVKKIFTKLVSKPLLFNLINRSCAVTTVSNSVASELKIYFGFSNAIVVGNGVDEKIFKPINNKNKRKYILYVGRLSYRKGLFDLLKCAKIICERYNINFFLIGKGELKRKLKDKINKEGLQSKVLFLGYVSRKELVHLYQNATVFVIPSHYEGLPTVILEAMACGLPVVATEIGANKDVINNCKNGLLIPTKSPEKMAEAISTLIEDEELRIKLGKNARKTIQEKFTWDVVTDKVLMTYKLARDAK